MKGVFRSTIIVLMVLFTVACGGSQPSPGEAGDGKATVTLTVFAAASLTESFTEIGQSFTAANPEVTFAFNFAGSNELATQINNDAPADVFASANEKQMAVVIDSGRVMDNATQIFATNRLVVIYPAANPAELAELADLTRPGTLVVLAAAEVPVGQYSLDFLDKAAADPVFSASYRDGVLANVVSYEKNVRAVLNKVLLGEADAGIVYTSDLAGVESNEVGRLEIPDTLNTVAMYSIAPTAASVNATLAADFVDYVNKPAGQEILAKYGFGPAQ